MKLSQRLAVNLASGLALAVLVLGMAACSGTTTPPPPQYPPASTYKPKPQKPEPAKPEEIPVGSPIRIRAQSSGGVVWVFDGPLTYERLHTFIKADDSKGLRDLIDFDRAAQVDDGTHAKLISRPVGGLVEIRVQAGPQKGKLWLVDDRQIEDNRTPAN